MTSLLLRRINDTLAQLAPSQPVQLRVLLPLHASSRRASLASATYVAVKRRRLSAFNIDVQVDRVELEANPALLTQWLRRQSADASVAAAFVQLPLVGSHMPRRGVSFDSLDLIKDVDGLTSESVARLGTPRQVHIPATALGIAMLVEHDGYTSTRERGTHVAIVGKGRLCGSPLAALLASPSIGASVTQCDVFTRQTSTICHGVDVIVSAVGGGHVITAEHVGPESVVIDVGAGDVSPDAGTKAKVFVSRVGELTVAALAANTINADRMRHGKSAIDFVQLARNAHLLREDLPLPLDAALAAPLPPPDDDGRTEPWFQSTAALRETAELTLENDADVAAALALFALPRDRPMTVILSVRATKFSNTDAVERLCCAIVRATDIVCIAVQLAGPTLSPFALAADYCLTQHDQIDVAALLAAPSALSVARARIGDVVMVPGIAFGNLVRDGSAEYQHSLVGYLRQHHNRIRVAALQRKLELRLFACARSSDIHNNNNNE